MHIHQRIGKAAVFVVIAAIIVGSPGTLASTCADLGVAQPFNAWLRDDFLAQSSDVEGRIAVGRDLSINHYSLGDKLTNAQGTLTVIAGRDFQFQSGRIYFGDARVGGRATLGSPVRNGLEEAQRVVDRATLPMNFVAQHTQLRTLSNQLAALPANGTVTSQWGGLYLDAAAQQPTQVFDLSVDQLSTTHTFDVRGIPAGATLIFNIRGDTARLANFSMQSLAGHRRRVIFNFPQATRLTLAGISVEGSILAPEAEIEQPQGVIKGHLIARSWNGMMQINHEPFEGCLPSAGLNRPPRIASSPVVVATVGKPYRYSVVGADPEQEPLTYLLNDSPPGMSIDSNTGRIEWIPSPNQVGDHSNLLSVFDNEGASDWQRFDVHVVQGFCPIYPIAIPDGVVASVAPGSRVSQMPRGTGPGNYSWLTWSGSNNAPTLAASLVPPGDSHTYRNPDDANDQVLNIGDFAQGAPGSMNASAVRNNLDQLRGREIIVPTWDTRRGQGSNFDYRVKRFIAVRLQDWRLTGNGWLTFDYLGEATCYNLAPQAFAQNLETRESVPLDIILTGSDPDGDEIAYSILSTPEHGVLEGVPPHVRYQPVPGFNGADAFEFRTSDGELDSAPAVVQITVTPVNDAPLADDQSLETQEDTPLAITLTGSDPDGDSIAFKVSKHPAHGLLDGQAPNLSYVPNANFHGLDSFEFSTDDGQLESSIATVSITVLPVNDPPMAEDQALSTQEDSPITITLSGADPDGDPVVFVLKSWPTHGTLHGDAPNLLYTPQAEYSGPDAFEFSTNDGQADSALATVSITVLPVNDPPSAQDLTASTNEDTALPLVLAGSDPEGDPVTFYVMTQPAHGWLTGDAPNLLYTPNPDYHGSDSFQFRTNDGEFDSATATAFITVLPVNDPPIAHPQQLSTQQEQPLAIVLTGADPEQDPLGYSIVASPARGNLDGVPPNLTYLPEPGYYGNDQLRFLVNDGDRDSEPALVEIQVVKLNRPPEIISAAPYSVAEGQNYSYDVDAVDPDESDTLGYSLAGPPADMAIDSSSGLIEWPAAAQMVGGVAARNLMCREGALPGVFDPEVLWHWRKPEGATVKHSVFGPVTVAPIRDTNGDGVVDGDDVPAAVFVSHGSGNVRSLNIVDGIDGSQILSLQDYNISQTGSLSLADLDADGVVEIIGVHVNRSELIALRVDGTLFWRVPTGPVRSFSPRDGVTVADLNADGVAEVVHGRRVYSASGELLWEGTGDRGGDVAYGLIPITADITGDGFLEIIAGRTVYRHDGSVLWHASSVPADGLTAVADVTGDGHPEVVIVVNGRAYLIDRNGQSLWVSATFSGGGLGGAPTIADMNGDGRVEIGIAARSRYIVLNGDGSVLWTRAIQDFSSNRTGSSVFDFDRDGRAEVVYRDEQNLHVFDGATGSTRVRVPVTSTTTLEYPTIVDINGDGSANILVGSDGSSAQAGVMAWGSASRSWAPTRRIWNQHAYNIDNINDDGSVPRQPRRSWETHNTYRLNSLSDRSPAGKPDLALFEPRLVGSDGQYRILVQARNRGLAPSAPSRLVFATASFDGSGSRTLGEVALPALAANEQRMVEWALVDLSELDALVQTRILSQAGAEECTVNNNAATALLATARVSDPEGLSDTQTFSVTVTDQNDPPVLQTTTLPRAKTELPYSARIDVLDPDLGEGLRFELLQRPAGMFLDDVTGEIVWTPVASQVGSHCLEVRVTDLAGAFDSRSLTLEVLPNLPPEIVSTPVTAATVGQPYAYAVQAVDPDDDDLFYRLDSAPEGMLIDPYTGQVAWTPEYGQQGARQVHVVVSDIRGGEGNQYFAIEVAASTNRPPEIVSSPVTVGIVGQPYSYQVEARDEDGDVLTFSALRAPQGFAIDPASGLASWLPEPGSATSVDVELQVSDGRGGVGTQAYVIALGNSGNNRPPAIISTPPTSAAVGELYSHLIDATDPDGDVLTLRMPIAPSGMSLDEATGEIRWVPSSTQLGNHEVRIEADDYRGGLAYQTFTIVVSATQGNRAPRIDSTPSTIGKAGKQYRYQLVTFDPDGDPLTATLTSAPAGMTLAPSGMITWTPTTAGTFNAAVRVSDGRGHTEQTWGIVVLAATVPLTAQVTIAPDPVDPGAAFTLSVQASGAAGPVQSSATLDGQPIALDADGETTLTAPAEVGRYTLEVTVSDGYDTVSVTRRLNVGQPADTEAPVATILSPREGTNDDLLVISAPQAVSIAVQDDELAYWVLGLVERGDTSGSFVEIASGTANVAGDDVGVVDTTMLQNGLYQLVLQAEDQSGNFSQDQVLVSIEGDMKIGHFSISFADLQVPVAGLPITVTRTYDTRQRHKRLDFGYGWNVDYQSIRLQESRRPGFAWEITQEPSGPLGVLVKFCIKPALGNVVSLTLPDGDVEKFRAVAFPECADLAQGDSPVLDVELRFEPMEGTRGTLVALENNAGRLVNGSLRDPSDLTTAIDPDRYRYTNAEGQDFFLDQGFTVREIQEHEGDNRVTFGFNGVVHSAGPSITFVRDAQGRISRVIAPDASEIRYEYDVSGDLRAVIDANGGRTEFTYAGGHYLEDIIDPRGVRVSRNEYNDEGRLVAVVDADGNRIEYSRDIDGRVEQVRDRNGHTTTYVYNARGDVLAETNAENETTLRSYDSNGNTLSESDPLGNTRSWTYDQLGNVLRETDPEGGITRNTFGPFNQHETVTDPLGRVVLDNFYRNQTVGGVPIYPGPLVSIRDGNGLSTSFAYSSSTGELTRISDPTGASTRFEVDASGFKIAEIDAEGARTEYVNDVMGRVLEERRTRTLPDGSTQTLLTTYTLDAKGNVTAVTHPDGSVTSTEYDGNDKPIRECDALGRCTLTEYDARGNVASMTYPDGSVERSTFDANGNLLSQTDRRGATTRFVYDRANRLIETIHPDATPANDRDNPRSRSVYDDAGRLAESIDERGAVTRYAYDRAGRRIRTELPEVDGAVAVITDEYDLAGRRIASTDAEGVRTEYVYDNGGRLTETRIDGTAMRVEYDGAGRKTAEVDAENRRTEYAYDRVGRLTQVTLAAGSAEATVTTYTYDQLGNKLTQTDAEGRTTRWEYDAMGRETARILPGGQREEKAYNAAGELIAHTDFNGRTTRFEYDNAGRLERIDYPSDADHRFGYDANGQRTEAIDGRGASTTAYDPRGRMLQSIDADGGLIEYQYDAAGNLIARISPHQSLHYQYDSRNRLSEVTRSIDGEAPSTTRYAYDATGRRIAMSGGEGTRTEYAYDAKGRLRQLIKRSAAGVLLATMSYQVDASGLRTAIEESDPAGIVRTVDYQYDALKRLTEERIDHRDDAHDRTSTWTYDRVGNRLTQTVTVAAEPPATTTYTYDTNDRLETETNNGQPTAYTYDANGNTTSKGGPDGLTQYRYDDANRLIEATTPQGTTTYVYNADGLRVRSTHTPNGGSPTTTWYLQDSVYPYAQVIEQHEGDIKASKRISATYAFADELVSQTRYDLGGNPTTAFVQMDGFGSTRWLTDGVGGITDSVDYDAFGNEIRREGQTEVEHLYRGERWDANVAAYDLRARLYTPGNGRFLTQDSFIGFSMDPRSLHKYAYAHGDPVGLSDPSGYSPLMSTLQAVNVVGNLYTVASIGFQIYSGNYVGAAKDIAEEIAYSKMGGAFGKRVANYTKEQVGLFYRAFEKTLRGKPRLGLDPSPSALSHNMEVFGVPKPTGTQAHHIVGRVTQAGRDVQDRLKALGIDLNSPMNGVFLPGCGSSKAIGMVHCGKHTAEYEVAVARRLAVATDKASAINILSDIRNELISNSFTKLNIRAQ